MLAAVRHAVGGGEADHDIAGTVAVIAAYARKTHTAALENAAKLPVGDGQIGAHDHDDGTAVGRLSLGLCASGLDDLLADSAFIHMQFLKRAVVALHQHAERIIHTPDGDDARRGAHAALEAVAGRASAAADSPLSKVFAGMFNRCKNMFLFHHAVADIVHRRVVALADHRIERAQGDAVGLAALRHVRRQRVVDLADVHGVGQGNGRFQSAQFVHLHKALRLAKAVEHIGRCGQLGRKHVVSARHDHRHAGVVAFIVNCRMTDAHAWYVCDFIQLAALEHADAHAVILHSFLVHRCITSAAA